MRQQQQQCHRRNAAVTVDDNENVGGVSILFHSATSSSSSSSSSFFLANSNCNSQFEAVLPVSVGRSVSKPVKYAVSASLYTIHCCCGSIIIK